MPDNIISDYLAELRSKAQSSSNAEMLQRLSAEQQVQEVLRDLASRYGFRFITDRRVNPDDLCADFVLQFDNYEARIYVQYEPQSTPRLGMQDLERYRRLLEKNDLTEAIIVVWTTEALLSLVLNLPQVKYMQQNPTTVGPVVETARSLDKSIEEFVNGQVVNWAVTQRESKSENATPLDTLTVFVNELDTAIQQETARGFTIPEKKLAAEGLAQRDPKQFADAIRKAIGNVDAKAMEQQLRLIIESHQ